jgi:hypothetical protein
MHAVSDLPYNDVIGSSDVSSSTGEARAHAGMVLALVRCLGDTWNGTEEDAPSIVRGRACLQTIVTVFAHPTMFMPTCMPTSGSSASSRTSRTGTKCGKEVSASK